MDKRNWIYIVLAPLDFTHCGRTPDNVHCRAPRLAGDGISLENRRRRCFDAAVHLLESNHCCPDSGAGKGPKSVGLQDFYATQRTQQVPSSSVPFRGHRAFWENSDQLAAVGQVVDRVYHKGKSQTAFGRDATACGRYTFSTATRKRRVQQHQIGMPDQTSQ